MNPYFLAIAALLLAAIAQTSIAWVALERFLNRRLGMRHRQAWLAIAVAAGLLALHHGYALELALRTGLYDPRQAVLAAGAGLLFALGVYGLRTPAA